MQVNIPLDIQFRVNEGIRADVRRGDFLVLSAAIVNPSVVQDGAWNRIMENRLEGLKNDLEAHRISEEAFARVTREIESKKIPITTYRLGGPEGWPRFLRFEEERAGSWKEVDWLLHLMVHRPEQEIVEFPPEQSCYVEYGLDPKDAEEMPREEHRLRARISLIGGEAGVSNSASVHFLEERVPAEEMRELTSFQRRATYFLKRGLYDQVLSIVDEGKAIHPLALGLMQLHGIAEVKRGNYSAALSVFETALAEERKLPPADEASPVLIQWIAFIRERMERERHG